MTPEEMLQKLADQGSKPFEPKELARLFTAYISSRLGPSWETEQPKLAEQVFRELKDRLHGLSYKNRAQTYLRILWHDPAKDQKLYATILWSVVAPHSEAFRLLGELAELRKEVQALRNRPHASNRGRSLKKEPLEASVWRTQLEVWQAIAKLALYEAEKQEKEAVP